MHVLVVDDDQDICNMLEIYLKNEGYQVSKAFDGVEALNEIRTNRPDILILDVMMPKKDGLEVAKEVRADEDLKFLPIIMLSAKTSDIDKIRGLTNGADDYVVKPFNPLEVIARIKSLIRRSNFQQNRDEAGDELIEVGPIIIRREDHSVKTVDGEEVQLTNIEFKILHLLASNANRVFSADEIFERVWQQESGLPTKTVMVHVSHLRDKLEKATDGEQIIKTVWGVGYKIEG